MLGHPVHPALVHFPLGLLLSSTIADAAWLAGMTHDTHVAAVLMAAGVAGGLLAMAAGMVDVIKLDQTLIPHAIQHVGAVGLAWTGYAVALYLRRANLSASLDPGTASLAISFVSAALLGLGGWLGGRLVYTFGANVENRPA
jgi:uncharacterized membrane protein